jgi:hypothetical protein
MAQIVNNFYARGESEELTVASVAKTMGEILKTHITIDDHREYNPISDELAFYVVKLLRQHIKSFMSHQQAQRFLNFGTTFDIQERDYWVCVQQSVTESVNDMKSKEILSIVDQFRSEGYFFRPKISSHIQQRP